MSLTLGHLPVCGPKPLRRLPAVLAAAGLCLWGLASWGQEDPSVKRAREQVVAAWQLMSVAENKGGAQQNAMELLREALRSLRGPQGDGTYKWATLAASGDEQTRISQSVNAEDKTLRNKGSETYRFGLFVDRSGGMFRTNHPVWIGAVTLRFRPAGGAWQEKKVDVNRWLQVGESWWQDLPAAAVEAEASVTAHADEKAGRAHVDFVWTKATLEDSPRNPNADLVEDVKTALAAGKGPYLNRFYAALKPLYDKVSQD